MARNPAWAQLLGLCPLLAVSTSVAHALGLALASAIVLLGSNISISLL
ncbi:MAG TPA: electron transport complex subunit RsxE, partial [Gammaproteobacteria bacterium]|nr:electron transport complex subunit RsxE [Gammaproteobacteria bacterium]